MRVAIHIDVLTEDFYTTYVMEKLTNLSLEQYLNELSSEKPVPGGGSVSALVASYAIGLTQMVGRISLKRKIKEGLSQEEKAKEEANRATIQKILDSLEKVKRDAFQIINLDPQVYREVMAVWGQAEKMEDALQNSFRLQADLAFLVVMAKEWNTSLAHLTKGSIKNDLLVSAALLEGAFRGAFHTAMINAHYMKDKERQKRSQEALKELKKRFEEGSAGADQGN